MAGYGCEFCEGKNPVSWLFTSLTTGATISVCEDDAPLAMIPMLGALLGADAEKLYDVIRREVDRQAKAEAKAAAAAVAGGPGGDSGGVVTPPADDDHLDAAPGDQDTATIA